MRFDLLNLNPLGRLTLIGVVESILDRPARRLSAGYSLPFCVEGGRTVDKQEPPFRAGKVRARNGMAALARTPVLPEAALVGAVPAQLRRPRTQSATSA